MVNESIDQDLRDSDYQAHFAWQSISEPRESDVWQITVRNQLILAIKNIRATDNAPFLVGAGYGQREKQPELDYFEDIKRLSRDELEAMLRDWQSVALEDEVLEKLWRLSRKVPKKGFLTICFTQVPY